jgi:hypothetical protein
MKNKNIVDKKLDHLKDKNISYSYTEGLCFVNIASYLLILFGVWFISNF